MRDPSGMRAQLKSTVEEMQTDSSSSRQLQMLSSKVRSLEEENAQIVSHSVVSVEEQPPVAEPATQGRA